ncbi:helix-turn-helix transcriptional regulator [Streptomyces johnsoniae]|uniref:LuxR C-terminal-related transcriptional regulator n=1 Tax=Streptomyces johnsoniae TaxID=3075532 RepID=A0ABU2S0T4_9ACTN|nr:AAA family ATPase [Streptomyces sp. DSM 41886]MDT0442555.1 LuxR C-terminal-related transcriptional regulator [Streptomyces sp. DSM 41886]
MRVSSALLLERDRELAAIDAAIEGCRSGSGQLLIVEGAAGLGKTALLAALRDRARSAEFTVLQARSVEFESKFSYGVLRQLFENWLSSVGRQERSRVLSGPAKLAAPLFEYGAAQTFEENDGTDDCYSYLYGLYWMCVHIAEVTPLALLIDDIEAVDWPSLRFLHYLAARIDHCPILLAITTDPATSDPRSEITRAITVSPMAQLLRPQALTEAGVRDYLASALGGTAAARYAHACHAATGGFPFLLSELTGELAAAERERPDFSPADIAELAPPKVVRLVLRQLDRLQPNATRLIEAMAVLGNEAGLKPAIEVAGLDQREVPEAQGALADAGLLRPDIPPRFVHTIVRAAVYLNLSASARNMAHVRAARALIAIDAPVDDIAAHFLRAPAAGDPETVRVLREAARKAVAEQRDASAVTYLTRALVEPPAPDVLPRVLVDLGRAELRCLEPKGLDHLSQAVELIDEAAVRGRVGLDLVAALTAFARNEEAVALLQTLRAEAGHGQDEEHAALLDAALLSAAEQIPDLRPIARRQLRRLEAAPSVHPSLGHLLSAERAAEALRRGEPADAVMGPVEEILKESFAGGSTLPVHDAAAHSWCLTAFVLVQCDRLGDADRLLTILVDGALKQGAMLAAETGYCLRAWVRAAAGRLADAESDARRALDRLGGAGAGGPAVLAAAALAEVMIVRQDLGEARLLLDKCDGDEGARSLLFQLPLALAKGRLYAAQGKTEAAVGVLGEGGRLLEEQDLHTPALALANESALALARAGRVEQARALADMRLTRARAFGAPRLVACALRVRGLVSAGPEAVGYFHEAVEALQSTGAGLDRAAASIDLGAALRDDGRLEQARAELTRGMEQAQSCGAWGLAKTARAELAAMGVRVRITRTTGVDGLTEQERRVAALAAKGKSNRDIAHALFVTIKTVEWHLNRAYRKLGIASRGELAGALAGQLATR